MELIKVLVVDDNESEFLTIRDLFEENSYGTYSIDWSSNKAEALGFILSNSYDAYIINYKLGKSNGIDLIREAKVKGCGAPFLLMTGYSRQAIDKQAQELGVDEYIVKKDLNYFTIEKSIRYALERKKAEKIFIDHQSKLLKSIKMSLLGELVSGVAHEINNPLALLSVISSNMKKRIQKDQFNSEDFIVLIKKIEEVIKRMSKITSSLTRYSRNSNLDPFEKTGVLSLIEESLEICMGKIRARRITIEVSDIPKDFHISCRPGEIIQVLVNLLNNSIDEISEQERPWIKIDVNKNEPYYDLCVTDSGKGIPDDLKEQIYTSFFTTKKSDGGTGLGLSISKSIVESHSGKIRFDNSPSGNTQVIVSLPTGKVPLKKQESKVLIIDNKLEMRSLLASILEEKKCKVFMASSYDEALREFEREPDISKVITDTSVDSMRVLDFITEINDKAEKLDSNLKIGLVCGAAEISVQSEFCDISRATFFSKPFDTTKLIDFCTA